MLHGHTFVIQCNPSLYVYIFIAVPWTSSFPTTCSRLTLQLSRWSSGDQTLRSWVQFPPKQSLPLTLCGPNSISRANAHMVYVLKSSTLHYNLSLNSSILGPIERLLQIRSDGMIVFLVKAPGKWSDTADQPCSPCAGVAALIDTGLPRFSRWRRPRRLDRNFLRIPRSPSLVHKCWGNL